MSKPSPKDDHKIWVSRRNCEEPATRNQTRGLTVPSNWAWKHAKLYSGHLCKACKVVKHGIRKYTRRGRALRRGNPEPTLRQARHSDSRPFGAKRDGPDRLTWNE